MRYLLIIGCIALLMLKTNSPAEAEKPVGAVAMPAADSSTMTASITAISLSPLRDKLAVEISGEGLLIVNAANGKVLQKLENCCVSYPAWSADGKELFFRTHKKDMTYENTGTLSGEDISKLIRENTEICRYDSDGFAPAAEGLIVTGLVYSDFLHSPIIAGMKKLYEGAARDSRAGLRPDLWAMESGGRRLRRLTTENALSGGVLISQDGARIFHNLYLSDQKKNVQYILDLRTMTKKPLHLGLFFDSFLALSQDERFLLFTKNPIIEREVQSDTRCYLFDLDEGKETQLSRGDLFVVEGVFLENEKSVVLLAKQRGEEDFHLWLFSDRPDSPKRLTSSGPCSGGRGRIARYDETRVLYTDDQSIYILDVTSGEERVVYGMK